MAKSMVGRNGVKLRVGDRVKLVSDFYEDRNSDVYINKEMRAMGCETFTIQRFTVQGRVHFKETSFSWDVNWLCHVELTKAQWLIQLIEGKIGIQSGNSCQRWRYNADKGYYEAKSGKDGWKHRDIDNLNGSIREFTLVEETEMTIKEIEEALGVKNLVVVS